ncbi:amino acid/polyamine/organocation transporter (APC superfamily) [Kribbella kalugense]|uniref:Amino acid/polyamine/organocation transporter (APC superfamily) n=2 Tax=Kribbella kalugense TaxID=2512221 RepID=A0A4R7ZA72_9ACTN|nr:amino acid/polyamine/organocation transporter (APC superfamily) [Kribbella kalugense]
MVLGMATSAAVPSARQSRPGLKRDIGFVGLIWASEGSIIGSGWLFGAQGALSVAGPAAIISWVIGGVAILILALVHAELGAMYPVSGGTARFPHYAFGGAAGASFGWFSWLQAATVAPIEVLAMITYGQHYSFASGWLKTKNGQHILTTSGIVVAVLLMAAVTAINFLSIRLLARTNSAATWWKVGIPLFTIFALAIVQFHGSNFTAANGFNPYGAKGILSAVSTSGIIFALLGFEQADQLAGESSNPRRDIPRAVIGSIVIGAIIYILLQIAFIAALPKDQIQGTWANAAYTTMTGPFAQVATLLSMGWLATILYIDAVVSPAGTGLIYITGSSRVSYGLSRNGYVPSVFEKTNHRGVPWVGLITAFIIGCICFLPFPSWRSLVGLITSASVLMYAGAPLSLGVFRRRLPDAHRPYRLPGATWLSPLAFVVANLLILWSGWMTDWKLGIAILIGYVILIGNRVFKLNPIMPQLDLRAAQWLPVYLVGMGLIVYLSDFGPLKHPWFPLWWDILVVAVFSLAIYFWALAVALPTEQIQRMVDQVVVPEEANLG